MQNAKNLELEVAMKTPEFEDELDFLEWVETHDTSALMTPERAVSRAALRAQVKPLAASSPAPAVQRRVGERIRVELLARGKRQKEFASELGKDPAWVSRVLAGRENLTLDTLERIAAALKCLPGDLMDSAAQKCALVVEPPPSKSHLNFSVYALSIRVVRRSFPRPVGAGFHTLKNSSTSSSLSVVA